MSGVRPDEALSELAVKNRELYRRVSSRYVYRAADQEDSIQNAFARFLKCGRDFDTLEDAERYLFRVLQNTLIDCRRTTLTQPHSQPLEEAPPLSDRVAEPETTLLDGERSQRVGWAVERLRVRMAALPAHQREVVRLAFLVDPPLSVRDIGRQMGMPVSTVHSRIRAALHRLRGESRELGRELDGLLG